jgi:hypothetical protein
VSSSKAVARYEFVGKDELVKTDCIERRYYLSDWFQSSMSKGRSCLSIRRRALLLEVVGFVLF